MMIIGRRAGNLIASVELRQKVTFIAVTEVKHPFEFGT